MAGGPCRGGAGRRSEGPRRWGGHRLAEPGGREKAREDGPVEEDGERRLEAGDSERRRRELHRLCPQGVCLAVINKTEAQQQSAFLMILDSIVFRH